MASEISLQKKTKKRVGIIHYTLPPAISGVEMVIRDHARLLSGSGFRVYLLGGSGKKFRSEIDIHIARSFHPKDAKVIQIQNELKKGEVSRQFINTKEKYFRILRRWIDKNKIEVVIVHNIMSRHYNLALTAALIELAEILKDKKIKFITWVHDASFLDMGYTGLSEKMKKVYPWNLIGEFQPNFTYVTISNTRKKELLELYGKDKEITVVPNGLDINKMLPLPLQTRTLFQDVISRDPDYIGVIPVRIATRKNIEYSIEFAKIARDKFNLNFVFIITGALHLQNPDSIKYYDFLIKEIAKYKLEKNFFFLYKYRLPSGERFDIYKLNIRDLYLISDFLFLPSKGEGFGLPIIEAGFMRTPIFASALDVFKEVGNGYINTIDLNAPIDDNINKFLRIMKGSRSTFFHKQIIKKYSLENIVKNHIITLIQGI